MTPQELMDLPGAGQAERCLRANGKWDEYAGLAEKVYLVKVCGAIYQEIEYRQKARHADEAEEQVEKIAKQSFDDIHEVTVTEAK